MIRVDLPRLHVLTPATGDRAALELVDDTLAGGAPCIQVRRKNGTDRELLAFVVEVVRRCRAVGATCLVNDRADVALAAGADGVHLGADDLPVHAARSLVDAASGGPRRFVVGGTARDPDQAHRLVRDGADYLGVGPVYDTATKEGLPDAIGLHTLAAVTDAVEVPVIAIAGIDRDRVAPVLAAGAHGVAVVGAVANAPDRQAATRDLLAAIEQRGGGDAAR